MIAIDKHSSLKKYRGEIATLKVGDVIQLDN
jgi:hypothetical protein